MRIAVVGGAGRVGLPLSVLLALANHHVDAVDIDARRIEMLRAGNTPFKEDGLDDMLGSLVSSGRLVPTSDEGVYALADAVIVVVGTDLDMNGKPQNDSVLAVIDRLRDRIRTEALVILRSTVIPGTTAIARERLSTRTNRVVYCPERIAEGSAIRELRTIPQIVGCDSDDSTHEAVSALFATLGVESVRATTGEAEMGKLILNAWRYTQFAFGNEFARLCALNNVNYAKVFRAIRYKYPRADGIKSAGLAGGPCLEKDTRQLIAATATGSALLDDVLASHAEIVNVLVEKVANTVDLASSTVALLGLTFKPGSDDLRASPALRVAETLKTRAKRLLVVDPHLIDDVEFEVVTLSVALESAHIVVVGTQHAEFRDLKTKLPVVDLAVL
jgi:UDP-N-acetyl-D-mannosaminuronic acid dehydrogenase